MTESRDLIMMLIFIFWVLWKFHFTNLSYYDYNYDYLYWLMVRR